MSHINNLNALIIIIHVFTVNDKDDMVRFIDSGVDGIFTDYPQTMKKILNLGMSPKRA
ncbi:MAG: hypothetical protein HQK61_03745 [Desulfamplus sp.]|nr:hypothetical protein [Desulfamplus sp.]